MVPNPQPPPAPGAGGTPAAKRRPVRRLRRLAWTAGISLALAVACVWIGFALYQTSLPPSYEAGEDNPDVTRKYAQPYENAAKQATRQAPSPVAKQDDGLIKVDRPLPSGAPAPRFADVTAEAGLASFVAFSGTRTSQLPEDMGSGLAWGDFDNDGFDDLFLVSVGGALNLPPEARARSELYRNLGNGTFSRVTDFPDLRILGMGAAWADCNNDGWLDLVVSGYDTLLLFRNEHGRFIRDGRFPNPKGFWTGVSWGDYDRDGWPDLYVCGYVQYKPQPGTGGLTRQFGLEVPYTLNPSSFEPARNLLFHNVHGSFTEVAAKLGVDNPDGRSLSALWQDFDDDGWPDLYVANDISESKLFLNRKGTFVDAGKQAWVSEYRGSMGLAAGDWDGDGDDDLFISHWVAQGYALYNSLLRDQSRAKVPESEQQPQLHFMDVAETYGIGNISLRYIGWGAEFVDFDSDGWLDLAVANGSTFETQGQPRKLVPMEAFLFWNNHGKFFFDLAPWNTSLSVAHVSRGLAVSDYDHDGAADIAIMNLDGGVRLLRNRIPQGNWIEFRLHSRTVGGALGRGEGARLIAEAGGRTFRRSVTTASYLSQSSRTVHLGLGQAPRVDALEVRWPDGSMQHFAGLAPNQIWDLTQGKGEALPWNPGAGGELLSRTQSPQHNVGSKQAEIQFWSKQRAAMDAMKREGDIPRSISLFREALALNPAHEDSRYYLANCLLVRGDLWGAVRELDELARLNPSSHRAFQRKGLLLASAARSDSELSKAQESLEKAHSLNPEETGTRLLLGELSLLRGDLAGARQRFELVCRSHARSVGALYLRAYLAWKRGDRQGSEDLLKAAAAARGKDWKPKGSVMEGDVLKRMHTDATLLSRFWDEWDGTANPTRAFGALDAFVRLPVAMRRSADSSPQSDRSEPARVTAVSSRRE